MNEPGAANIPLDLEREGPPAFVVVGKTGAGKSTLVNSIFGMNVAATGTRSDVTPGVTRYELPKTHVTIYDTPGAGGLDNTSEGAMRSFLQLDEKPSRRRRLPADAVIFVFSHDRIARFDFEFFAEVDNVYKTRVVIVKNYEAEETAEDFQKNLIAIESRCGRKPICVDALKGTNIAELVKEIFRLLPSRRLLAFNESLEKHRARAREMAGIIAVKYASLAAVIRGEGASAVRTNVEGLRERMLQHIAEAYVEDFQRGEQVSLRPRRPVSLVVEDTSAEAGSRLGLGAMGGALIGLVGGPLGAIIGGFLGALLGSVTTPTRLRGGSAAVLNLLAYARGLADVFEKAFDDPLVALTQGEAQTKIWLKLHQQEFARGLEDSQRKIDFLIRQSALGEYLDQPNTTDPAEVESRLLPVVQSVF